MCVSLCVGGHRNNQFLCDAALILTVWIYFAELRGPNSISGVYVLCSLLKLQQAEASYFFFLICSYKSLIQKASCYLSDCSTEIKHSEKSLSHFFPLFKSSLNLN